VTDRKNIVTLGIGASPGKLMWFLTSGLETGAAVAAPTPDVALGDIPMITYWMGSVPAQGPSATVSYYDVAIVFHNGNNLTFHNGSHVFFHHLVSISADVSFSHSAPRTTFTGEAE
jgi:hypothetical protein